MYCQTTTEMRREEKQDMVRLNDKLSGYVQRIRNMGGKSGDSAAFLDALRSIEEEISRVKNMYECELTGQRRKLEDSNRQKNEALSEIEKYKRASSDFEDRFRVEGCKNAQLIKDLQCLQTRVSELERELSQARSAVNGPQSQMANMQKDMARESAKNQELSNELDRFRAQSKQWQDKIKSLEQNLGFNDTRNGEQLRDANNRLEQSKKVIIDLEKRASACERQNASLPELIEQMRRKTEADLACYKKDMEASSSTSAASYKKQLEDQERCLQQMKTMVAKLEKDNCELQNRVRSLEAQVRELHGQKSCLETQLQQCGARSSEHVRALEQKLKELQEILNSKMNEVNAGKDVQLSLRAEIEAMRIILEDEERRLAGVSRSGNFASRNCNSGNYGYASMTQSYDSSAIPKPDISKGYSDHKASLDKTNNSRTGKKNAGKGKELEKRTEYQFSYNRGGPVPTWARTRTSADKFPVLANDNSGRSMTPQVRQSWQKTY